MKILCHVGPWCASQFEAIAKGVDEKSTVLLMSGFRTIDRSGLVEKYYQSLNSYDGAFRELSDIENDIIDRCRLLRSLERHEAKKHLLCMRESLSSVFDKHQPNLVLSESIDQFLIDLLREEAKARNIKFIGLIRTFVNGYYRISARGEYNKVRNPEQSEIEDVLKMLDENKYVPSNVFVINRNILKYGLITWAKNLIKPPYFLAKRIATRELYNYHYWSTQIVSAQKINIFPKLIVGDLKWKVSLKKIKKPIIFIPLQYVPEATVDYWCDDISLIDYEKVLISLVGRFSDDFHFVIKEHPGALGYRRRSFYRTLSSFGNVTYCPTVANSRDIIDASDAVLVWTGSAGFEAALRGKPVLTLGRPYYLCGDRFKIIDQRVQPSEIMNFIHSIGQISSSEKEKMIRFLLSGMLRGTFNNDGSWCINNPKDCDAAQSIGNDIRKYLTEVLD